MIDLEVIERKILEIEKEYKRRCRNVVDPSFEQVLALYLIARELAVMNEDNHVHRNNQTKDS